MNTTAQVKMVAVRIVSGEINEVKDVISYTDKTAIVADDISTQRKKIFTTPSGVNYIKEYVNYLIIPSSKAATMPCLDKHVESDLAEILERQENGHGDPHDAKKSATGYRVVNKETGEFHHVTHYDFSNMMMRKLWINYKGKQITRCMRNRIENNKLVSINGQTFELVNALAAPVAPVVETVTESAPAPVAPVAAPAPVVEIITAPVAPAKTTNEPTMTESQQITEWVLNTQRKIATLPHGKQGALIRELIEHAINWIEKTTKEKSDFTAFDFLDCNFNGETRENNEPDAKAFNALIEHVLRLDRDTIAEVEKILAKERDGKTTLATIHADAIANGQEWHDIDLSRFYRAYTIRNGYRMYVACECTPKSDWQA